MGAAATSSAMGSPPGFSRREDGPPKRGDVKRRRRPARPRRSPGRERGFRDVRLSSGLVLRSTCRKRRQRRDREKATMRFGIFYEHQLPKPWNDGDEARLFHQALEQVVLADRLGYDYAWEVEHHFLEEYSHSSAPEVFLAGLRGADQDHPRRPRHPPGDPQLQPSGPHRRGAGDAGHHLQRPARLRHRRGGDAAGAGRLPHPGQGEARHGDRGRPSRSPT